MTIQEFQAIQSLFIYNNGVPSCIMRGVIDARAFHEIPEEELLNTDMFPLSYEEAMELEEIDRFNEAIKQQTMAGAGETWGDDEMMMGDDEDFIDYDAEMENMAFLYEMNDILTLAQNQDDDELVLEQMKRDKQQQQVYESSKYNKTSNRGKNKMNSTYRKPKHFMKQPQSRHMFVNQRGNTLRSN